MEDNSAKMIDGALAARKAIAHLDRELRVAALKIAIELEDGDIDAGREADRSALQELVGGLAANTIVGPNNALTERAMDAAAKFVLPFGIPKDNSDPARVGVLTPSEIAALQKE